MSVDAYAAGFEALRHTACVALSTCLLLEPR